MGLPAIFAANGKLRGAYAPSPYRVGDIRLVPFPDAELEAGDYICNGEFYSLTTPQGQVLNGFSAAFKTAWGITVVEGAISLPNLFDPETGAGYFFRPVDGTLRALGSTQGGAIPNITGSFSPSITTTSYLNMNEVSGVFGSSNSINIAGFQSAGSLMQRPTQVDFDASTVVPTADENRPANVGMLAVIHLGVN
jgi:hypothetical protein